MWQWQLPVAIRRGTASIRSEQILDADRQVGVQVIIGWGNDVFGAEAFRALDGQMKGFFDDNPVGLLSGSSGPSFNKPDIQQSGPPAVYAAPPES
ncbi:hypothetical protein [Steroidobacter cummioxidans]|uniref:hypothetical protein n=1 Tax=Steroidobacter cummioxidans TaxID=1803913 RepID=UPI000E315D80|nr:hypothetical protein [Steroidobacter cummioxidans]